MIGLFVVSLVLTGLYMLIALGARSGDARMQALRTGIDGRGIILWADKTATRSTLGGVRYESRALRLDVEVPGQAPYEVSITPLIPRVCEALPGSSLDLRVSRDNPNNIAVLGPAGSLGWMRAMPALFPQVGPGASGGPKLFHVLFFSPIVLALGFFSLVSPSHKPAARSVAPPAPPRSHEICEAAARCCSKITPTGGCSSFKTMPEATCKTALETQRKIALKMKKVCE